MRVASPHFSTNQVLTYRIEAESADTQTTNHTEYVEIAAKQVQVPRKNAYQSLCFADFHEYAFIAFSTAPQAPFLANNRYRHRWNTSYQPHFYDYISNIFD